MLFRIWSTRWTIEKKWRKEAKNQEITQEKEIEKIMKWDKERRKVNEGRK
jgi:hypothetical protein